MGRYKNQLAGLSLPINVFSVLLHILAVFTIIFSQLNGCKQFEQLMLWIGVPVLAISLILIILFKGYFLLVQHARLTIGFILLILSLVHIAAISDFFVFLHTSGSGLNNPYSFLKNSTIIPYILAVLEFVVAMALIIGAWIQKFSVVLVLIFAFYGGLFWCQSATLPGDQLNNIVLNFGLDRYLIAQLNWNTAFLFCLFMVVIGLVGILFGNKIRSNSVRLNWAVIPIYTLLAVGLAVIFHWYQIIFIIPLSISMCLITYRSGGRFFGNHFGSILIALIIAVSMCFLNQELGLAEKQNSSISAANKNVQ